LTLRRTDLVRARFKQTGLHYSEVLNFLVEVEFLRVTADHITKIRELSDDDEKMKQQLVQHLVARESRIRAHLNEFLSRFKITGGRFEIVMDSERRRRFSGIRNVLLDLDF